jgi:hypothetical protein
MPGASRFGSIEGKGGEMATMTHEREAAATALPRYEYRVLDTGPRLEDDLNALGAQGWRVVGVTTKKQLFIAPPQAIILMRELAAA